VPAHHGDAGVRIEHYFHASSAGTGGISPCVGRMNMGSVTRISSKNPAGHATGGESPDSNSTITRPVTRRRAGHRLVESQVRGVIQHGGGFKSVHSRKAAISRAKLK